MAAHATGVSPQDLADRTPSERVARFHVRDVEMPGGAGTMALVTMDNGFDHTRPTTFGPKGLLQLQAAMDEVTARVDAGRVSAVGLTGKPFVFAVGADLSDVGVLTEREQALALARLGHDAARRLGELGVPSFAFVNGAALGGGVEIALHCSYRTLSAGVTALALPECFLGLVPGWGGTYLLPRLVGPAAALELMVANPLANNRMLRAAQAHAAGFSDVLLEPADFLERSIEWAAAVVRGDVVVERTDHTADAEAWAAACHRARAAADARLHGSAPAPYRAVDLVEASRTRDRDAGFAAEDEALADLVMSQEFRSGAYAFQLVQRRAKRPAGDPGEQVARPVTKVGVVGAGLMAGQLALLFARRLGVPVVMTDVDDERVRRGLAAVHAQVDELAGKGRLSPDAANRLRSLVTASTSTAGFADADLVIEAVFEDLDVKRQVVSGLEAVVRDDCVLATNTSSLSVSAMAAGLAHPERVVGIHFFNPVAVLPLVEVVRGERTDDATLATAFAVGRGLGKSCVLVRDAPAFVVNRLLTRLMGEVIAAIDEGTPPDVADRALLALGLPTAPLVLLQLVGPAVALHVAETLHAAFGDRFGVSENLRRIVAAGRPGLWSLDDRGRPVLDEQVRELLVQGDAPSTEEQVRTRALDALAQEVSLLLAEGVVDDVRDVDLCLLLGANWPFHLGGITPYLDRTGTSERVTGGRFLPPGVASPPG